MFPKRGRGGLSIFRHNSFMKQKSKSSKIFGKCIRIRKRSHILFSFVCAFLLIFFFTSIAFKSQIMPQGCAQTSLSTLTVNVFDESGFPPSSINGSIRLPDIPVNVFLPDDTPVANTTTNINGTASFLLPEDQYKLVYGGTQWIGVASQTVNLTGGSTSIDLYCFYVTFHDFDAGGPFELDHVDMDTSSVGYQSAISVDPGQQINAEFSWWELETQNVPVWLVSAFGDWAPTSALGNLESGGASPTSHFQHNVALSFSAPVNPGIYTVRLVGTLDYDWPISYYTGAHPNANLGRDMGVSIISKSVTGPYGTGEIVVRNTGPRFDFISIQGNALEMKLNSTSQRPIGLKSSFGYTSSVELQVALPPNMDATIEQNSLYLPRDGTNFTSLVIRTFWNTTVNVPLLIQVIATGGNLSAEESFTVTVDGPSPFEISLNPTITQINVGNPDSIELSILNKRSDFNSPIEVGISVLPTGLTCTFDKQTLTADEESLLVTLSVSYNAAAGPHIVTINGSSEGFCTYASLSVIVQSPSIPFALAMPPTSTIVQGRSISLQTGITLLRNDFDFPVELGVANLPPGVTCSFSKQIILPNETSTVSISAAQNATPGQYQVKLTQMSHAFSYNFTENTVFWLSVEASPIPVWMQTWFWALLGGVAGIMVVSSVGQFYYKKWRKTRVPLDVSYLAIAGELSQLEEQRLLGKISQEEYEKNKKEYERKLKGE